MQIPCDEASFPSFPALFCLHVETGSHFVNQVDGCGVYQLTQASLELITLLSQSLLCCD